MNILHTVDLGDFSCEVSGCSNNADYYVEDFDGDYGYICKPCYEDELRAYEIPTRGPDVSVGLIENREKPEHFLVQLRSCDNSQYPSWIEFPGGKVETYEDNVQALVREIQEEVGILVRRCNLLVTMEYKFPSGLTHKVHFFLITQYDGKPEGKEGQRIEWLTLWQLMTYPKMLPLNRAAALILTTERHPDILE